jgi:hypothetical protein
MAVACSAPAESDAIRDDEVPGARQDRLRVQIPPPRQYTEGLIKNLETWSANGYLEHGSSSSLAVRAGDKSANGYGQNVVCPRRNFKNLGSQLKM